MTLILLEINNQPRATLQVLLKPHLVVFQSPFIAQPTPNPGFVLTNGQVETNPLYYPNRYQPKTPKGSLYEDNYKQHRCKCG